MKYTVDTTCPHCGVEADRATAISEDIAPVPGDLNICFYCAGLSTFNDDMTLCKADVNDLPDENRAEVEAVIKLIVARI